MHRTLKSRTLKQVLLPAATLMLTAVLASCGGASTPAPTPTPNPQPQPQDVVVKAQTRVLDAASRNTLTTFTKLDGQAYELRFNLTDQTKAIAAGNVLVSEPGPHAPAGYLIKVSSVKQEGTQVIVQAQQARLTDAIDKGQLNVEQELKPDMMAQAQLAPGVKMQFHPKAASAQGLRAQGLSAQGEPDIDWTKNYNYSLSLDKVYYDVDGNNATTNDQVASTGMFYFNLGFKLYLNVDWGDLDFRTSVNVDQGTDVKVYARGQYEFKKNFEVAKIPFTPITFPVGPVPVVIVPHLTLFIDASGKIQGEISYAVKQTLKAGAGMEYIDDFKSFRDGPHWQFGSSGVQASASAQAQVGPRVRLDFLLYDVAGMYGEAAGYAYFKAQYPGKPLWEMGLCGDVNVGVHADLIIEKLEKDINILHECTKFSEAPNSAPVINNFTVKDVSLLPGVTPAGTFARNDDLQFCAAATDAEDGQRPVTFTGPDGLNASGDAQGCTTFSFKTTGDKVVTVTAKDAEGLTATKTMTVKVVDPTLPAPVVSISSPINGSTLYMDGASLTQTLVGKSDLNDCTKEKWTSSNAADLLPTDNCGSPTVIFTSTGSRTLTLTATNAQGTKGSATTTVNVQPKPVQNLQASASVTTTASGPFFDTDNITANASMTDPENDAVQYTLKLYRQDDPTKTFTLASGTVTNTKSGVTKSTTFTLRSAANPACQNATWVLELTATDGQHTPVTSTKTFKQQCIK